RHSRTPAADLNSRGSPTAEKSAAAPVTHSNNASTAAAQDVKFRRRIEWFLDPRAGSATTVDPPASSVRNISYTYSAERRTNGTGQQNRFCALLTSGRNGVERAG